MIKKIRELSLRQKMFFPSFAGGILFHLLLFLILVVGLSVSFWRFQRPENSIEIGLYRSFKKAAVKKAVPRGERKIVEDVPRDAPCEVVEEDFVDKVESDNSGKAGAYLGSIYRRIERRKYYPEIEKEREHEGVVEVGFIVKEDGSLEKAWIVKNCKHGGLNRAALQAVKRAAPFMPIPEFFKKDRLPIVISIVYEII